MNFIQEIFALFSFEELFLVHVVISFALALLLSNFLKHKYITPFWLIFITIFGVNFIIPFLGYLFTITLTVILLITKKKRYLHNVETFNYEEFLKNSFPHVKRIFGEGAIRSFAKDSQSLPSNKMKSLVFMSNHPCKENFSLIKELLSDSNNEIRLYSFSVLSNAEDELNEKISHTQQLFEDATNYIDKAKYACELAFYYWEFLYFGLSDEETNRLIFQKVDYYAKFALKHNMELGRLYLLLGKSAFLQKSYVDASIYFQKALKLGMNKSSIALYLAEISYNKKEFKDVRKLLLEVNPLETSLLTAPLRTQWTSR